jgi:hypothetical protein
VTARSTAAKTVTHHYTLASSAFIPDGLHDTTEDYFNRWEPPALSNSDSGRCFNAGLSLPTGATLKGVTVYYTAGSNVMFFDLIRQDLVHNSAADLVSFDTAVSPTSSTSYTATYKSISGNDAAVNMTDYAYSVGVCPNGTTTFSGLNIAYTVPAS